MPFLNSRIEDNLQSLKSNLQEIVGFKDAQSYSPLINKLFELSEKNADKTVLELNGLNVRKILMEEKMVAVLYNGDQRLIHIKFCPLRDPLAYVNGCFSSEVATSLPKYQIIKSEEQKKDYHYGCNG